MSIDWQVVINTLGGGVVILAAAAWLIRTVLNHALAKDTETFKARLKADADVETEKLRSSLQMIAAEHQIRFANLHAKRAEVIAEIYSQMVDAEQHGQRFVWVDVFDKTQRPQAYSETSKRLVEFYYFLEKRRIYLPETVCMLMKRFVDTIRKNIIRTNIYEPIEQPSNLKVLEEKIKVIQEASEAFEATIPAARAALENEFRHLLGVEQETVRQSESSLKTQHGLGS